MATTVAQAEAILRLQARNAQDSSMYTFTQAQYALMLAGNEWMRIVKPIKNNSTMTLTVGSTALPSLPAGFIPEYTLLAYASLSGQTIWPPIQIVSYEYILELQASQGTTSQGPPRYMAFTSATTGVVYPQPDQAYVVTLSWWSPFTTWTPSDGNTTALNVNDEQAMIIASTGAVYYLQGNEPDNLATGQAKYQMFLKEASQVAARNPGGLGSNVAIKPYPVG